MTHALTALAVGLGIPGFVGAIGLAFGIAKDGSPFTRSFWTAGEEI